MTISQRVQSRVVDRLDCSKSLICRYLRGRCLINRVDPTLRVDSCAGVRLEFGSSLSEGCTSVMCRLHRMPRSSRVSTQNVSPLQYLQESRFHDVISKDHQLRQLREAGQGS